MLTDGAIARGGSRNSSRTLVTMMLLSYYVIPSYVLSMMVRGKFYLLVVTLDSTTLVAVT